MLKKKEILISVIIPTFNCGDYICDAVHSVIDQSYKKWEIIIVDDGSTDNTSNILKPLLSSRIKYFCIKHSGPLKSRIYGATVANGEFLVFLDADDCFHKNLIELLVNNLSNLVIFKERIFYEIDELHTLEAANDNIVANSIPIKHYDFSHNYLACSMVNKTLFIETCSQIPNNLKHLRFSEDMMMCSMLASNVEEITKIDYPLYFYRRSNANSITHTLTFSDYMGRFEIVDFLYKYLNDRGFNGLYFGCRHIFSPFVFLVKTKQAFLKKRYEFERIRSSYSFKIPYNFSFKHKIMFVLIRFRFYVSLYLLIKFLVTTKKV